MSMRMISKESTNMVYHRPECRYARKIHKVNRMQMTWEDAEWKGYRPCKCCDGAVFLYSLERDAIENYAEMFRMDVDMKNNKIYIRTNVGCWKIVYIIREQRFILFHKNYVSGRIRLDEVENVSFHRQTDVPEAGSIMKYIKYIRKHDEFKQNLSKDYHQMPRDTKRQKRYYESAKRRAERHSARRVENLFEQIERQEGIKSLSYC